MLSTISRSPLEAYRRCCEITTLHAHQAEVAECLYGLPAVLLAASITGVARHFFVGYRRRLLPRDRLHDRPSPLAVTSLAFPCAWDPSPLRRSCRWGPMRSVSLLPAVVPPPPSGATLREAGPRWPRAPPRRPVSLACRLLLRPRGRAWPRAASPTSALSPAPAGEAQPHGHRPGRPC